MNGPALYVAETDCDGRVEWVWIVHNKHQSIRPFDFATDRFDPNQPNEFFGASPMKIIAWLAAKQYDDLPNTAPEPA